MSDIVETLSRRAETLAALSNCDVPKKELKSLSWRMEATGELRRAAKDNVKAVAEITRLRQLLSEAETREREARAKALEDLRLVAERVGKRDAYSDDVIKYAFQRGVVAAAKRFSSAVSALQSEER